MKKPDWVKKGTKVKLRKDVLLRHARSIPPYSGYTKEQFAWRELLRKLEGKTGVIERAFSGKHCNVRFGNVLIGIDYDELVKAKQHKTRKVV